MLNEAIYEPSPWQAKFHALTTNEALGAGAAGPGKTVCLLFEPLQQIIVEDSRTKLPKEHKYHVSPGASAGWALHLRRTLKQLEQTMSLAHQKFPLLDPGATWDSQRTTWTFSSGYKYQFGHCKESSSWADYVGNAYTIVCFDELNQFEEEQYDQIKGRVRTSDPVLTRMRKIRAMSNPTMRREASDPFSTKDPSWVRRYFVDPCPDGNKILGFRLKLDDGSEEAWTRIYLPARLSDNPNKQFARDYEIQLQSLKPHIRQALLYGNWDAVVGAYWGEDWVPSTHTCEPFAIPYEWPVFRSIDWGFKKPGCALWGTLDNDDNLYVIRELYFQGKTDREVALAIHAIEEDMELWVGGRSAIIGPADTQLWEQRGQSGLSMAQAMARCGVHWTKADKRSRQHNAERLLARLQAHESSLTQPGIRIFRTCRNLIRTLPIIQSDPTNAEEPMDGGEDHAVDACMYMCAYVSHGRKGLSKVKRLSDPWDEKETRPERGMHGYGGF